MIPHALYTSVSTTANQSPDEPFYLKLQNELMLFSKSKVLVKESAQDQLQQYIQNIPFLQDKHTARATAERFGLKHINLLIWPSQSLDVICENLKSSVGIILLYCVFFFFY